MDIFMKHVNRPIDVNECWEWTGYKTPNGYGWCRFNGKSDFSHRVAYRIWKEDIPEKMVIRHTCRNKCVNPAHIELGTYSENQNDRFRDETDGRGMKNPSTCLTDDDVREIKRRRSLGEKLLSIAIAFDVKQNTISRICNGKTWKHIV
jgi:hypothetical protein